MPGKKGSKKGQNIEMSGSAGVSGATDKIDHAFVADDKKSHHPHVGKITRQHWLILGVILLALIIGGGVVAWQNYSKIEPEKPVYSSEGILLRKLNQTQLEKELQKLIFQKKFRTAEQLINYQDNANSITLKMLLASTYMNQGKLKDALRVLLEMERQNGNIWQLERTIGDVYLGLGEKQQAAAHYKKALELLKNVKDVPTIDDIHFLEQSIKQAEGQ